MRFLGFLLLCASATFASDPATLHTEVVDDGVLSFRLENNYQAAVTKFQVGALNSDGNLGCSVTDLL